MPKRIVIEGSMCIYRESSLVEHLSADVKTADGQAFYYYRAPKCFDDLIVDGIKNVIDVRYTANEDGSNPRSAVATSEPRSPR